ncbi:MAG: ABC transporter permease, partial [Lachnospiraceae bacterium]|nr:ABC transporter permease [Lachnospiraceae bacterium]
MAVITTAVDSFRLDEFMEQRIAGDYILGHINITGGSPRSGDVEIEPEYLALADSQDGIESRRELWVWYGSRLLMDEQAREQYRKLDAEGKLRRESFCNESVDRMLSGEEQNMAGFFYGYSEELLRNLEVLEGTLDVEKFLTGDYILLTQLYSKEFLPATEHAYHPGDKVTVESITEDTIFHEETNENGEITGVVYENLASKEYEVMAIVNIPYSMNLHRYTANGCDAILPISEFGVTSELFAVSYQVADEYQKDFEAAVKQYSEAHQEMGYVSKDSLREEFEGMITVISTLGIALCAIIALIGMLNFVNAVVTEIISRKREFAMLQSIGMTGGQLRKMLVCEGISYVMISGILSFLIGSPLSWLALNAMNKIL